MPFRHRAKPLPTLLLLILQIIPVSTPGRAGSPPTGEAPTRGPTGRRTRGAGRPGRPHPGRGGAAQGDPDPDPGGGATRRPDPEREEEGGETTKQKLPHFQQHYQTRPSHGHPFAPPHELGEYRQNGRPCVERRRCWG